MFWIICAVVFVLVIVKLAFRALVRWAERDALRDILVSVGEEGRKREDEEAQKQEFISQNTQMLGKKTAAFSLLLRPFLRDDLYMPLPRWANAEVFVQLKVPPLDFAFPGSAIAPVTTYELALKACMNTIAPLITVAPPPRLKYKRGDLRAGHLFIGDEGWQHRVHELLDSAKTIFVLPGDDPGILWEIQVILNSPVLLGKTLFLIPRAKGSKLERKWWEYISLIVRKETGLTLPLLDNDRAVLQNFVASGIPRFPYLAGFQSAPFDEDNLQALNELLKKFSTIAGLPPEAAPTATFYYMPTLPRKVHIKADRLSFTRQMDSSEDDA